MPKKTNKDFFEYDDRPSRFLLDLNSRQVEEETEDVSQKNKLFSSFFEEEEDEHKYSEPVRKKFLDDPKPVSKKEKKEKDTQIKRLAIFNFFRILQHICYLIGFWTVTTPKKIFNKFHLNLKHRSINKKTNHVATPASRALMSAEAESFRYIAFTKKKAFAFVFVLFVLVLPLKSLTYVKNVFDLKGKVMGVTEDAASELKGAAKEAASLNFEQATRDFSRASNKFMDAKDEIKVFSKFFAVLGTVIPNKDIKLAKSADLILDAGRLSADIGSNLTMAFSSLAPEKEKNIKLIVNTFYFYTGKAAELSRELEEKLADIDVESLPYEYQGQFAELKDKSGFITSSLDEVVELLGHMKVFLGFEYDKRYLLVFQNNTELRASGGFIGSYALVDFRNGEIKNLEVPGGGSYDTEAGLRRQIVAPEPLHLVNPQWHFWDSNWWPDWPTTARKLMWFYEKSDGPSVDGVISFTPTVLERILEVLGSVDLTEKHGIEITADNFWIETQRIAETKPVVATSSEDVASSTEPVRHEPKKIIGDLMNKMIEIVPERLDKDMFIELAGVLEDSLNEKHVLFYFVDEGLEQKTLEYGWDGSMKKTAFDYLMVVNTNVAGGKTDRVIRETVTHKADVSWDGSVVNTVTIKREHTGEKHQEFTGVRNNDWIRVYVPKGSELIKAEGFSTPDEKFFESPGADWEVDPDVEVTEGSARVDVGTDTKIYTENGKTVFANWSQIDPGQTAIITLQYRLPFKLKKQEREDTILNKIGEILNSDHKDLIPYALMVQKQPGSIGTIFKTELNLHSNFGTEWLYREADNKNNKGWGYDDVLKTDKYFGILINTSDLVSDYY